MGLYRKKFNKFTQNFDLVNDAGLLFFREGVANAAALPPVGNVVNDARITNDNGHLYVWNGTNWVDQGDILNLDWSDIANRPTSAVADIDDAVSKRHTQNTDLYLDTAVTNILYVDNKRTDSYLENGHITKPYKTIQAAIDYIASLALSEYFTIKINNGIYAENLVLENVGLKYLKLQGDGYVSINPAAGNALQSTADNDNLVALHLKNIIFAKPVVVTGSNGAASFSDVVWEDISFTGTSSLTATCINSISMKNVYSEKNINYVNVNWSYIESSQLQGSFAITMDDTQNLPSWGKDGNLMANGVVQSGAVSYTIGGTATYTPGIYSSRWGSSNPAVTIPNGVTIYAYNSWLRPTQINNGAIHLRNSTMQGYIPGTGTLNIDNQPASQFKNDSSVTGATVKDALETLDSEKTTLSAVKLDSDIADAITKKHIQNADTKLDEGGENEVSALSVKGHIDDADKHREINDSGSDVTDLWSAQKIINSIASSIIENIYRVSDIPSTATVYYVATDGNDSNDGLSRTASFLTIQHAIDTATNDDIILVYEGIYEITQEIKCNKDLIVIGIYGAEKTIIQPTIDTQIRCLYIYETKKAIFKGFTFQNGYTTLAGGDTNSGNGGGVCIWQDTGSSPETDIGSSVQDCIIKDCYAQQYGGGAYMMDYKSAIINCKVYNCSTALSGLAGGGGIGLRWEGYARNCLIYDCNGSYGAGILCYAGTCQVHNCTIVDNLNAGIVLFDGTKHQVYNSIVYHNPTNIVLLSGSSDIKYTNATPLPSGTNNFNEVPEFINRTNDNYKLVENSFLVDKGLRLLWQKNYTDLDGKKLRYVNSIGAYSIDSSIYADYILRNRKSSQVTNDSSVTGNTVKDALETLDSDKTTLGDVKADSDIADAISKTHEHANKSALDNVSGTNTGDQDLSGLENFWTETTINLTVVGWEADSTQTVELVGLTAISDVKVYPPVNRPAFLAYGNAQISAISTGVDSITFECTEKPTTDIEGVIVLWR